GPGWLGCPGGRGARDGGAHDGRAPRTPGGRPGPWHVLTHGAMARADARGHGTGRRTGLWHGPTHGAMARADTRGHGTGRHTGPWHVLTHGADGPGQRAPSPLTIEDCGIAPPVRAGLPRRRGCDDGLR